MIIQKLLTRQLDRRQTMHAICHVWSCWTNWSNVVYPNVEHSYQDHYCI